MKAVFDDWKKKKKKIKRMAKNSMNENNNPWVEVLSTAACICTVCK